MRKYHVLFCFILLLFSCQSTPATEQEDALAKDLCKCMGPLAEINKKTQRLMQQGRMEEVQVLFGQIEQLSKENEECKKNLELKYGILEGEKEEKATLVMHNHCPDIARMIEQKKAMEQ